MAIGFSRSFSLMWRLRFSPAGELLSFAWPKESNQRKGHPWCVGLRLPCDARQPGRCGNSPWRAQTPRTSFPRPAALLGDTQGASSLTPVLGGEVALRAGGSRGCSSSALPISRARAGQEWNRVRAPRQGTFCVLCQGELVERPPANAKSRTRRAAMWGRLFSDYFGEQVLACSTLRVAAKQTKVTRPQAKREAIAHTARHSCRWRRTPK